MTPHSSPRVKMMYPPHQLSWLMSNAVSAVPSASITPISVPPEGVAAYRPLSPSASMRL